MAFIIGNLMQESHVKTKQNSHRFLNKILLRSFPYLTKITTLVLQHFKPVPLLSVLHIQVVILPVSHATKDAATCIIINASNLYTFLFAHLILLRAWKQGNYQEWRDEILILEQKFSPATISHNPNVKEKIDGHEAQIGRKTVSCHASHIILFHTATLLEDAGCENREESSTQDEPSLLELE